MQLHERDDESRRPPHRQQRFAGTPHPSTEPRTHSHSSAVHAANCSAWNALPSQPVVQQLHCSGVRATHCEDVVGVRTWHGSRMRLVLPLVLQLAVGQLVLLLLLALSPSQSQRHPPGTGELRIAFLQGIVNGMIDKCWQRRVDTDCGTALL